MKNCYLFIITLQIYRFNLFEALKKYKFIKLRYLSYMYDKTNDFKYVDEYVKFVQKCKITLESDDRSRYRLLKNSNRWHLKK